MVTAAHGNRNAAEEFCDSKVRAIHVELQDNITHYASPFPEMLSFER